MLFEELGKILDDSDSVFQIIKNIKEWVTYDGVSGEGIAEIDAPDKMNLQIEDFYFTTGENSSNSISVVHKNTSLGTIGIFFEETSSIKASDLKEGDTLHVYLTGDDVFNALDEMGYVIAQTKFEITVPDLGDYVTEKKQLTEENIKTQDYSIGQEHSWQNGKKINGKYAVTNTITLVVHNTDLLGQLIDDAVKAGANGVKSLTFKLADNSSAMRQARTAAVKQAQDTAALLAGASGSKLGPALKITESNASYPAMVMYDMVAEEASKNATSIQTGKLDINASVTITFELQ